VTGVSHVTGASRLVGLRRVLAAKRALHPELARPLTWRGLQRVLAREGVRLRLVPLVEPAQLAGFRGTWAILVNADLPPRRHTYYAAHELGHLWLHVDPAEGRGAKVYHFDHYDGDDPREEEAELLATWLLGSAAVRRSFAHAPDAVQLRLALDSTVGRER
jgi:hypothetical protein